MSRTIMLATRSSMPSAHQRRATVLLFGFTKLTASNANHKVRLGKRISKEINAKDLLISARPSGTLPKLLWSQTRRRPGESARRSPASRSRAGGGCRGCEFLDARPVLRGDGVLGGEPGAAHASDVAEFAVCRGSGRR